LSESVAAKFYDAHAIKYSRFVKLLDY